MALRFDVEGEYCGWYLARKSNTEPVLVMRVEAVSQVLFDDFIQEIDERVSPIIDISKLMN